ncbi:MAG: phosphoglucosamine mutase [Actinomycetota bacterium]|nr:phosphoglucosamine mutase [Actinomycetota bacterium]
MTSSQRLFGTDGVRGLANGDVLTPELALAVAASAATLLTDAGQARPHVVLGRDPRPSGEMLEAAAVAGFTSAGCDVTLLGVVPTPAVAHATADTGAPLGLMISASHNPAADNGLKLFGAGGWKLPDDVEDAVAAGLRSARRCTGAAVGRVLPDGGAQRERYVGHLRAAVPTDLGGLRVVVDCAQGAASDLAPRVYREAGAEVVAVAADADGYRINERCGATHLETLQAAVREAGADLGLAHDGDADRCLAVDAAGEVVDGDQLLALLAVALHERGELADDTVVATVMSNLGFVRAMEQAGIGVVQTAVGDRYVLEALRKRGLSLGGEQSGHTVQLRHATTGDGLLTGLAVLGRLAETGRSLADLAAVMTRLPQVLVNVRAGRSRAQADDVRAAVAREEEALAGTGRVLLRPSGTEPLVRVMVEAETPERARDVAERLAAVVGAD